LQMSDNVFSSGVVAKGVSAILRGESAPEPSRPEVVQVEDRTPAAGVMGELEQVMKGESLEKKVAPAETHEKGAWSLDAMAEKLGVEVGELYELEVPMPDGAETLKLSELKDMVTANKRQQAERLEWETTKERERNQMANERTELTEMLSMVPPQFRTKQMLEKAQAQIEHAKQAEAMKLIQRVPEWRDPVQFAADMEVITPHVAEYGFSMEELSQVYDHRLLAYIRANALRESRIAQMLATAKGQRVVKGSPVTSGRKPDNKHLPQANKSEKLNSIAALLRG
jgi:hypothetical protein